MGTYITTSLFLVISVSFYIVCNIYGIKYLELLCRLKHKYCIYCLILLYLYQYYKKSMVYDMRRAIFRKRYGKTLGKFIPDYSFFSLIACFFINCFIYWGTQLIIRNRYQYDLTTNLDNKIPFIKEWVVIYLGCYAFWAVNYILVTREGKEEWFRFAFSDLLSKVICGIIFIILPTTNIRPEVAGNDIFSILMRFVYYVDLPVNLFPSLHCLVSWFCFIGIRKSKKIPLWYKVFSCIFAFMVCMSTQFTKQHYLIDIAGGIIISELCYFLAWHTHIYIYIERFFLWMDLKVFGDSNNDEQT